MQTKFPPWFTEQGIDLGLYPIDDVLRRALSDNDRDFRSACSILKSMCSAERTDAGVFLMGLLKHFPENFERLTIIADSLEWFHYPEAVEALAAELRRVPGSNITRRYLRRVIDTLVQFPPELVSETIRDLSIDSSVGARFRQHLKAIIYENGW